MQAVPLATFNGSVMSAFKPHTLSPPSVAPSSTVYEISAAAAPAVPPMEELEEDKCSSHDEGEVVEYNGSPSYYHTLDQSSSSRGNSPDQELAGTGSPHLCTGNLTPVSASSSKDDSSSSSSSEVLSGLEDDGTESASLASHLVAAGMCVPSSTETSGSDLGPVSGTHVKHWTYEDQFKQVSSAASW